MRQSHVAWWTEVVHHSTPDVMKVSKVMVAQQLLGVVSLPHHLDKISCGDVKTQLGTNAS